MQSANIHYNTGPKLIRRVLSLICAFILAVLVCSVLILIIGSSPLVAYKAFFQGTFGSVDGISEIMVKAIPLIIVGLGISIAFQAKFWNIGAEGQILMGAISATWIGTSLPSFPGPVLLALTLAGSFLAGAVWGGVAGILKARYHLNEVIVTIMMNYIATYLQIYLVRGPLIDKSMPLWPASKYLPDQVWFPQLIGGSRMHAGLILAIFLVLVVWLLLYRMPLGFRIQATGQSRDAASYSGINVGMVFVFAISISGGLSGLAGANEVLGVHHRLLDLISAGYGFTAIVVAVLGKLKPLGVLIAGVAFGAFLVGGNMMQQAAEIPTALIVAFQGIILVSVLLMEILFAPRIKVKSEAKVM